MRILVIGGAGYIGSHVVKDLLANGHEVTVFDNLSSGHRCNLFPNAVMAEGDITDTEALRRVMQKGFDGVVHLAAKKAVGESMENPQKYAVNNLSGTINILNAMADNNIKYLVFSSSAAVYGIPQYLPIDERHPTEPINFYGFTKLDIEKLMNWYDRLKGIKYIALRYFNAAGYDESGDIRGLDTAPQNLLPIIMEAAIGKRDKLKIFGNDYDTPDGTCIRDYIHVSDLASAHTAALNYLQEKNRSEILNLGTETGTSVLEMLKAAEKVIGRPIAFEFAPRRPGDPARLTASAQAARQLLDWKPRHSDIDNIVRSTWTVYS